MAFVKVKMKPKKIKLRESKIYKIGFWLITIIFFATFIFQNHWDKIEKHVKSGVNELGKQMVVAGKELQD